MSTDLRIGQISSPLLVRSTGRVQSCAHRGHRIGAPENTLTALRAAADLGAQWCEIDLVPCADDLVVIHDATLDRTTNGRGPVSLLTVAEIKKLDAGRWFAAEFEGERLVTLAEVLDVVGGTLGLLLELKEQYTYATRQFVEGAARVLEASGAEDRAVITSFDQGALRLAKEIAPGIRTEFITHSRYADPVAVVAAVAADMICFDASRFRVEDAEALHDAGVAVRVHVPLPSELECLDAYGMNIENQLRGWIAAGFVDMVSSDDAGFGRALADCYQS